MAYKLKVGYKKYRFENGRVYSGMADSYGRDGRDFIVGAEMTASTLSEAERKAARAFNRKVDFKNAPGVERIYLYNGNTWIGEYIKNASGNVVFIPNENASQKVAGRYWYVITGTDRSGKRFKRVLSSKTQAMMYNVYRGTLWKEDKSTGKREKIYEWWN